MKLTYSAFLIVLFLLFLSGRAEAAIVTTAIFPGEINNLHDQDAETIVDSNGVFVGNGATVAHGDFLLAVFEIENIKTLTDNHFLGGVTNIATGVSLLKVDSLTAGSFGLFQYHLVAASSSEWASVTGLTGIPNGTVVSLYDNPSNVNPTTGTTIANAITIAAPSSSDLLWNFGFTGTVNGDGSTNANLGAGEGWNVLAPDNLNGLGALVTAGLNPGFKGALNVIGPSGSKASGIVLNPTTDFAGTVFPGASVGPQLLIEGNLNSFSSSLALGVGSGSDNFINPSVLPEPSSFVILAIGSILAGIGRMSVIRRKQAK